MSEIKSREDLINEIKQIRLKHYLDDKASFEMFLIECRNFRDHTGGRFYISNDYIEEAIGRPVNINKRFLEELNK